MPKKRVAARSTSGSSGGAGKTVFAFVLGAGAAAGAGYLYLHSAPHLPAPPAPVAQQASPAKHVPAPSPAPSATRTAPFGTSEDVFEAGAHRYAAYCASCHGTPKADAALMAPAQQFWRKGRHTLTSKAPGDLYTGIAAGNPVKGMPAYAHTLTDTQIWQLALLLKNADQDLPDPVVKILDASPRPNATSK